MKKNVIVLLAVESIASGTPILSTPTSGVNEILENCDGCFFESIDDQKAFIFRIKNILDSKNIFVNKEFAKKFTTDKIGKAYEELL